MKNTKKTLWIKTAAIMLAISAIFLLDVYAGNGPGGGGGGEGRNIYDLYATVDDCLKCHFKEILPEDLPIACAIYHHEAVYLCTKPCGEDGQDVECLDCLDCHKVVSNDEVNWVFDAGSDCLKCHNIELLEGPPGSNDHHDTDTYYEESCDYCHKFLLE